MCLWSTEENCQVIKPFNFPKTLFTRSKIGGASIRINTLFDLFQHYSGDVWFCIMLCHSHVHSTQTALYCNLLINKCSWKIINPTSLIPLFPWIPGTCKSTDGSTDLLRGQQLCKYVDWSKILKWGPNKPPTFKNGGPWNIIAAIIFELPITLMLYLDFQRVIVQHNFHVCAVFFEIVREYRNTALWIHYR